MNISVRNCGVSQLTTKGVYELVVDKFIDEHDQIDVVIDNFINFFDF